MPADFKQSTNLAGKVLASGQCASGDNAVYTVPASSAVKVASAVLFNASTAAVTVTTSVVPSGQTLDATRRVMTTVLQSGDSTSVSEIVGGMYDAGTVISVNASAATSINYLLTGAVSS